MIELHHLYYSYQIGKKGKETAVPVLKDVNMTLKSGEIVAVVGKSGSGKSTLLHVLSGFIYPDAGHIEMNGMNLSDLDEKKWAAFRRDNFGFIFQNYELIPSLTAFENVELPMILAGVPKSERKKKVNDLLEKVGLETHATHYPNELSGGQQQRVSIARSLISNPKVILADEPTGALDSETEQSILSLIQDLNKLEGITFMIITHDEEVASIADRTLRIHDGILKQEKRNSIEAK